MRQLEARTTSECISKEAALSRWVCDTSWKDSRRQSPQLHLWRARLYLSDCSERCSGGDPYFTRGVAVCKRAPSTSWWIPSERRLCLFSEVRQRYLYLYCLCDTVRGYCDLSVNIGLAELWRSVRRKIFQWVAKTKIVYFCVGGKLVRRVQARKKKSLGRELMPLSRQPNTFP